MAKPPETTNRMKFGFEVDDLTQVGAFITQLTLMGAQRLTYEVITDIVTYKGNRNGTTAADFLSQWLKEHPTFTQKEVVQYFKDSGRTPAASYYGLRQLLDKRIVKKLDDNGNYTRADVRHIEPPKKASKSVGRYEVSNSEFILRYARRNHGRFNIAKLREVFEADGRNPSAVSPSNHDLLEKKLIKRIGDAGSGQYVLLVKAAKPKKAAPRKRVLTPRVAPTNGNGHAQEVAVEVTHG
jgi:hypothetical protein